MSTTFAGRLDGADGRDLRLYLTIDGIADVFQEDAVDVPSTFETSTRTRRRVIQTIEQGQSELDLDRRRMVGGSLRVVLVDDFADSLGDLFASRSRRTTYVTATTLATQTFVNVSSTAALPSSGTVYIGGETITYTAKTATQLTGCTRGAFGSTAQRHVGGTDQGAGVYVNPPRWVGRRVRLWGYFLNDDGTTTTSLRSKLDTFRLEAAPVYLGQGRWELRCSHLSDEVAQRKIGSGLREQKAYPVAAADDPASDRVVWTLEGQSNQWPATTSGYYPTFAAVRFQDEEGVAILRFRTSADTTYRTEVATDSEGDIGNIRRLRRGFVPETVAHWCILKDSDAGTLALFALTSIIGNAANGAYDLLPGTERDTGVGGDEMHFGAGILAAEVDANAFVGVGANAISGWSYVIHEAVNVADFLADFCLATESFWLVDADGVLTVRRLSEARTTPILTVDDDLVIGEPTVELAEDAIYPRARIDAGYDPLTGDYLDSIAIVDVEMASRYPERGDELELQTRGFCLSEGNINRGTISRAQLETLVRRAMVDDGRGRLYLTVKCLLPGLQLDLGDVVNVSLSLPDYEGSTLTTRTARVVARKPDYDAGVVDLRLQVLETLRYIAPAAVISSVVGTTINLDATSPVSYPGASAYQFAVNDVIELVNVTTGALEERTVSSTPTTSSLVVTVAPTITAAGNYIRVAKSTSNAGANVSTLNYRSTDYIYQQPATTNGLVTRWR